MTRQLLICTFLPPMDLLDDRSIGEQIVANRNIFNFIRSSLDNEIDIDEAIEAIEEDILYGDMDVYLDEVDRDLELIFEAFDKWKMNQMGLILPS